MRMCTGCGTKLPDNWHGKCDECKSEKSDSGSDVEGIRTHTRADAPSREKYAKLYSSRDWTQCARIQLARFPFCERCKRALATIADHFIPAEIFIEICRVEKRFLFPERAFFYMGNLQSLCRPCHGTKTDEDKKHVGPWPDLFANPRRPKRQFSF